MHHRILFGLIVVMFATQAYSTAWAETGHAHAGDIAVGRTGAGQVSTEGDAQVLSGLEPLEVSTSISGLINGWSSGVDSTGFDHLHTDEPTEDFYALQPGVQIRLEVITIDAGVMIQEQGTFNFADAMGESIALGGEELHSHPTWIINSDVVGSGFSGTLYGTFKLIDLGPTNYGESDPFTLGFSNVPEPSAWILLALGSLVTVLRRRS